MTFTIRAATASDLDAIRTLTLDGIQVWANSILANIKPWIDETCSQQKFLAKLNDPNLRYFVAEIGDTIVGTIYLDISNPTASYMGGLYCSVKKCGLGTALLQHAFDASLALGYSTMDCEIYENNLPSIALMQKYGAKPTSAETVADATYVTYSFSLAKELAYA